MNITVLMGGDSPEREISLLTGQAVVNGLKDAGHEVQGVDIQSVSDVLDLPGLADSDVVFPALHGGQGEDGHLQAILDVMGIPYALSGAAASALAMDKSNTKRVMRSAGIPTPDWLQVSWDRQAGQPDTLVGKEEMGRDAEVLTLKRIFDRASLELGFPLVIKLNGAGSSVGVAIVRQAGQFEKAFTEVVEASDEQQLDIILEKFVPGRELTATIFLGRRLPLLEIRPLDGFYDYDNKYTAGASDYLVPAPVHSPIYEQISADALRVFELVGCQGVARVDFRLDGNDYYCLEINTIPGMTEHSLVPKSAAAVGIGFSALVDDLCRAALPGANAVK
jgi:D-alanine-D-alanine ligase